MSYELCTPLVSADVLLTCWLQAQLLLHCSMRPTVWFGHFPDQNRLSWYGVGHVFVFPFRESWLSTWGKRLPDTILKAPGFCFCCWFWFTKPKQIDAWKFPTSQVRIGRKRDDLFKTGMDEPLCRFYFEILTGKLIENRTTLRVGTNCCLADQNIQWDKRLQLK